MNDWADEQNGQKHITNAIATHGRRLFSRGEKNASKLAIPPKMTLGEGILFPFYGRGRGEEEGGKLNLCRRKLGFLPKTRERNKKLFVRRGFLRSSPG